jgi:hypothetical protein
MGEHSIPEITASELRAISRKLTDFVALHPGESDARNGDEDQRKGRRLWPDPETTKALVNIIVESAAPRRR